MEPEGESWELKSWTVLEGSSQREREAASSSPLLTPIHHLTRHFTPTLLLPDRRRRWKGPRSGYGLRLSRLRLACRPSCLRRRRACSTSSQTAQNSSPGQHPRHPPDLSTQLTIRTLTAMGRRRASGSDWGGSGPSGVTSRSSRTSRSRRPRRRRQQGRMQSREGTESSRTRG